VAAVSPQSLKEIATKAGEFVLDPLGYAFWAYPWGERDLEGWERPDDWQCTVLDSLGKALRTPGRNEPIRISIGAANGVGKTSLGAIVLDWAMSTSPFTRGTVTANTQHQLRTKTWAELSKWRRLSITKGLLELQATSLISPGENAKDYRIDAVPWSAEKPEATAGMHNKGRRVILWSDEASSIDDIIWEYQDASTTDDDTEIIWLVTGNTTRNTGRFKECWGRFDSRWIKPNGPGIKNGKVDGREAKSTNKKLIAQWAADYGEDHDFFRVRVRAEFPRVGELQFFPSDWVYNAKKNEIPIQQLAMEPAVIAVDVAGGGTNKTVITNRRGGKLVWQRSEQYTPDTMVLVARIIDIVRVERNVRCICVDANGIGKGVADRLSQLHSETPQVVPPIVHVYGSHGSSDPIQFRNLRSELYSRCRDWLRQADIPYESPLIEQMESIQAGYNAAMQIEVETKKQYLDRTKKESPDEMDSLVYSFAEYIYSPNVQMGRRRKMPLRQGRPL